MYWLGRLVLELLISECKHETVGNMSMDFIAEIVPTNESTEIEWGWNT